MKRQSVLWLGGAAFLALGPAPATAQQAAPPALGFVPQPTPTADKLAAAMSTLGRSPQDVEALIAAGEASAALDDAPAALQFLARAEKLRPADPRIPAARGRAFVRMGRPGEALRRFADAERRGLSPETYADDRGLAYDLVGDQAHAQQEYHRALALRDEAEIRRRLAISQAISGDQPGAERTLDPLLRQQDRAAWRTRALVMAIGGNTTGAERVTATMMPGFSSAYLPLFRRLSEIRDPADRAFAAHLGEFTRTPARLADAALAPLAPSLPQRAPVMVADAASTSSPAPGAEPSQAEPARTVSRVATKIETARADTAVDERAVLRARRDRQARAEREAMIAERFGRRPRSVQTASIDTGRATGPVPVGSKLPVGRTPLSSATNPAMTSPRTPSPPPSTISPARPDIAPLSSAANAGGTIGTPRSSADGASKIVASGVPPSGVIASTPLPQAAGSPAVVAAAPNGGSIGSKANSFTATSATITRADGPSAGASAPLENGVTGAATSGQAVTGADAQAPSSPAGIGAPPSSPSLVAKADTSNVGLRTTSSAPAPGFSTSQPTASRPPAPATPPVGREDDVLAMIVRNIAIPANELGVVTPPAAAPQPASPPPTVLAAKPAADDAPKPAAKPVAVASPPVAAAKKAKAVEPKPDPKAAESTKADKRKGDSKPADAKAAAGKNADGKNTDSEKAEAKKADAKKAGARKGDAKTPEPKKSAEPSRWWVQVAGGANVADLPKAWNALISKTPALKKRQAWTTPLRFTNRLLTGPFASRAEAQAYVNTLGKDGLSAFAFQSEAGQKVTRLPAK